MLDAPLRTVTGTLRRPVQFLRRQRAMYALRALASHRDPQLRSIGLALKECLAETLSTQEQEALFRIEQRRAFLLASEQEIAVVDYGAGSPTSQRTREEMEKGNRLMVPIADITAASKAPFWATCLFKLVRALKPQSCVELGSCVGISASYQASALRINGKGTIATLEGSPEVATIARETLHSLGLSNVSVVTGRFQDTLNGVMKASKPVDFFFNDGHHDHDAVIRYFDEAMPFLSSCAVVVFDDISWSHDMRKAWAGIQQDERVAASIDLQQLGIVLVNKDLPPGMRFRIPLAAPHR